MNTITSDFVNRVGAGGFHDIKRSTTIWAKSIWIFFVLLAWAFFLYQAISFVSRYFSYPFDTTVEMQFMGSLPFPSVMICNLNPVKFSKLPKQYEIMAQDLLQGMKSKLMEMGPMMAMHNAQHGSGSKPGDNGSVTGKLPPPQPPDLFAAEKLAEFEDTGFYTLLQKLAVASDEMDLITFERKSWNDTMSELQDEDDDRYKTPEELQVQRKFYEIYYSLTRKTQKSIGHSIEDMLMECMWQEQQCYPQNFTFAHHAKFGNCFNFNAGWDRNGDDVNKKMVHEISLPGPSNGLSLMLNVQDHEYIPLISSSTGVRVHVHDQASYPFPEDFGFTVSSGYSTSLEMRKTLVTRLDSPYNSNGCGYDFTRNGDDIINVGDMWPTARYTMNACMKHCYQSSLHNLCQCIDPRLPAPEGKDVCKFENMDQEQCRERAQESFRTGDIKAVCKLRCPNACNETEYFVQTTAALWPNDQYMEILENTLASRAADLKMMFMQHNMNKIRQNILKLEIYFETLRFEAVIESASYKIADCLSDMGGAIGFWIGISVLSLCQFIEYFAEIFLFLTNRNKNKLHPEESRRRRNKIN